MACTLRLRVTAPTNRIDRLIDALEGHKGVESVVQVADLAAGMDDDSSSAGLPDDNAQPLVRLDIDLIRESAEQQVRDLIEIAARDLDLAVEYTDVI